MTTQTTMAVIGAGPAGLAAALTLSRSLQKTLVFDATTPFRNRDSPGVGAVLGRDRVLPGDLRGLGRQEIEGYGFVRFVDETVSHLQGAKTGSGFEIRTGAGPVYYADRVLLACGMIDLFPEIPGLSSFWGTSIINCPFCHGYELRHRPWGVFVNRPEMLAAAEIYRTWTEDIVFFLEPGPEPAQERAAELTAQGFGLERRRISRFIGTDDGLTAVRLEDGTDMRREGFVIWPFQKQTDLVADIGLTMDERGFAVVDPGYRTNIDGLYAAGDLLYREHQNINTAMHMGNLAASTMVFDQAKQRVF
ncbi:NAD(P)/FAD-dependent oxidoreductase [Roseibium sp. RKSG952]|uniref:NAD(P)/FAD-dependent oxidoreductase n=1 Tax=Roseibium sp. RKSG952 TaxID=2529384 RepID=UPI0012BC0984|nr:NAD(P)/FAD-dependent oxidoreductase [Roseibium sp. RKSG952]MTH98373.1 NAD(P)/FAD-dependent oxidoreductase [Roseibium sp. RKSG952]